MSNFTVTANIDNNTAEVLLHVANFSALNAGSVDVELDPRRARKIAIRLLELADEAEDQAAHNLKRAQADR